MYRLTRTILRATAGIIFGSMLLLLFSTNLLAQKVKTNKKAEEFLQKALLLADSAKYDSAVVLITQASEIYKRKHNIEKYIHCKNEIIKQLRNIKFNDELLSTARENLDLALIELGPKNSVTGESYSLLGNVFDDMDKIDSALYYFGKAKEIWELEPKKNKLRISSALLNIGQMYMNKGDFGKSVEYLNKSLKIRIDSLGSSHPSVANIYNILGALYYYKGKLDSCEYFFNKVVEIREKCYGDSHPLVADAYICIGVVYKVQGNTKEALLNYKKALDIRKKGPELQPNLALCYSNIGIVYKDLGKYELANENYEKALQIRLKLFGEKHKDVAACYTNIGINCGLCGEDANALMYAKKAFDIEVAVYGPDNPIIANTYNNLGVAYDNLGDQDKALEYYKKSLQLLLKTDPNNILLSGSYNNIGIIYDNRGEYELALNYYKAGLKVFNQQGIEKHKGVATSYHNMGGVYLMLGDYDKAFEYLNKNISLQKELYGENYYEMANVYWTLGKAYNKLGNFEKEKFNYEKGLNIIINNFGAENVKAVGLYNRLASNCANRKKYAEAFNYLQKSIRILSKVYSEDHPVFGTTYAQIALIHKELNNYDSSIYYLNKSLDANYIGKLTENIDYQYVLDDIQFFESFFELAEIYYTRFKKENKISYLRNSVVYYQKAFEMISFIVSGYTIESSKLTLLKEASGYYSKAIRAAELLYIKTKNSQFLNQALLFSEQNKSTILYGSIVKTHVNSENFSDSLWVNKKNLSGKINYLKNKIIANQENALDSTQLDQFDVELSKAIIEYTNLDNEYNKANSRSNYAPFINNAFITQLQLNLKSNEAVLEYFVTDSAIYCFVIGKDLLKLKRINIESDFNDKIISYISIIKKHRFGQFQRDSYYLYDKLIKPVEGYFTNKTKLIIIPDGQLLYLPFGSLISKKHNFTGEVDFSKLDYLIKKYDIVTQYSANLWLESFQNAKKNNLVNGFMGLAPFSGNETIAHEIDSTNLSFLDRSLPEDIVKGLMDNGNEFKSLPYSGKEVDEIAQLFESQGINTKSALGLDATEQKLKDNAKHYKYLHIATHGIINNIHPELSGLAFVKDKNGVPENNNEADWQIEQNTDGILYAKEIYDLDLNAELVVLSACETGIGKLEKGEGIMSLTRGFLYNKVPNIVFSLWKINDKNTCSLMVRFYENIMKGESYSSALRNAKLEMINNNETAFPANWAAFSLIGQ